MLTLVVNEVYFRHTKASELWEWFDCLHLIRGTQTGDTVPTYRVEGRTLFLMRNVFSLIQISRRYNIDICSGASSHPDAYRTDTARSSSII